MTTEARAKQLQLGDRIVELWLWIDEQTAKGHDTARLEREWLGLLARYMALAREETAS